MKRSIRSSAALLAGFALAAGASAGTHTFKFGLDGSQECPALAVASSGTATVVLDDVTGAVTVSGSYTGMTTSVFAAHIHGASPPGMCSGVLVTLTHTGGTSGTLSGGGTLTAAQVSDMLAGLHYINIHSLMHTSGEIRGQIICEPATLSVATPRNGTGCNFAGTTSCSQPAVGSVWNVKVDITTPGAIASIVALGVGGPTQFKIGFGELLCLPPYIMDIQTGTHNIPIPDDCNLVGQVACFQGAHFAPGNIGLQNAIDVTFGTF